jgi:hypothetical protein
MRASVIIARATPMAMLAVFSLLVSSPAVAAQGQAETLIGCGGYSPKLNDHVEWDVKIVGSDADRGDEHFKVSETKSLFVLKGRRSQIRINKATKSYVTLGSNKAPLEWSRNVPGEGCDISESAPDSITVRVRK